MYILHFAEIPLQFDCIKPEKRQILQFLEDREQIKIEDNLVFFKNFTGIIETNSGQYLA